MIADIGISFIMNEGRARCIVHLAHSGYDVVSKERVHYTPFAIRTRVYREGLTEYDKEKIYLKIDRWVPARYRARISHGLLLSKAGTGYTVLFQNLGRDRVSKSSAEAASNWDVLGGVGNPVSVNFRE